MPPRVELNLPMYKRANYVPDPGLIERVRNAVNRSSASYTPGTSTLVDWQQRPRQDTSPLAPVPELQPIGRYQSSLQTLKEQPTAAESIGESYQNRTQTTLQSGVDATSTVMQIMLAKQQEAEARQQQKLMKALEAGRSASGAVIPSQKLPSFSGKVNFSDYGERTYSPTQNKQIVQRVASSMGLSSADFRYLNYIIVGKGRVPGESDYRNTVKNPRSTAYGIGQFLDATWSYVGGRKTKNPALQAYYMIKYIFKKYGSVYNAYVKKMADGWY